MNCPTLSEEFLGPYMSRKVPWGFASGPNSLGELVYRRTYSRPRSDGVAEVWWETVQRVVEGTFEILYSHCDKNFLPFDKEIAQKDMEEMYERIFSFKFTPPGRGLWMMGTAFVRERGGAALNNCGFVSTEDIDKHPSKPFCFLMDMSMLGVGVGFDTRGAGKIRWSPKKGEYHHIVSDSREGWVTLIEQTILWGFGRGAKPIPDVSHVRKAGEPIRGFGGISSGPEPLMELYQRVVDLVLRRAGELVSSRDIVDIMNFIGCCVVAGNVRRTAEIAFGDPSDDEYMDLKDYDKNPERAAWGWTSNNSCFGETGMDYDPLTRRYDVKGEMPGIFWLENARKYGRMKDEPDNKDYRALGCNPCGEQTLESFELCCLVETYPHHHVSLEDFRKTLKYAYLYAKAVTLVPTHWRETNAVTLRNRRIGCSVSGVAQFLSSGSERKLIKWLDEGYKTVCHYDRVYSEWLAVRESIKKTSVKPSGTVSLLAGATPGAHYPTFDYYIRRVRYAKDHPDVEPLREAGYKVEPDIRDPYTVVVEFPVQGPGVPTERDVSLGHKVHLASLLQKYWADNQVSYTATFDPKTEGKLLKDLLRAYEDKLKAIVFLPLPEQSAFEQMPYEAITSKQYEEKVRDLREVKWTKDNSHDQEEKGCDGATCIIG